VLRAGEVRGEGAPGGAGARPADRREAYLRGLAQAPLSLLRLRPHVYGATRGDAVAAAGNTPVPATAVCTRERGAAHAEVARAEETTRYQVWRAFALGSRAELEARAEAAWPRRLSLDEAHHRRGHELATIVSDPDKRRVVEVLEGRSRRIVERYLRSLPAAEREAIRAVSIDPYDAYRQAVRQELPQTQIVSDPFHLVRGANEALDTVRRQRQHQPALRRRQQGRKPRKESWRQQLFRARHRLLKARERLSFQERRSLCEFFDAEPLVAEAWALKEAFRAIYRSTSRIEAEQRLARFLAAVDRAAIPSFTAFAEGIPLWRHELLAYFDQPITNGYAEGSDRQSQGDQAQSLRPPHLQRLPSTRPHSMRLTGPGSAPRSSSENPLFAA
jgi:transposase